jgi:hypothetical protein
MYGASLLPRTTYSRGIDEQAPVALTHGKAQVPRRPALSLPDRLPPRDAVSGNIDGTGAEPCGDGLAAWPPQHSSARYRLRPLRHRRRRDLRVQTTSVTDERLRAQRLATKPCSQRNPFSAAGPRVA